MANLPASNVPELSVSELSAALKRMVEERFGFVRLRGEISNYRGPHSSGHVYFSLKDEFARIDAVIWKGTFARLKTKPQEGLEVIVTGKITTFPGKSSYQIVIDELEPAGIGTLMALIEERRRKLAAEGLFDEARKRPLPYLPSCIGVVTSPAGAVIRDILHRISERFPRHVLVWPVRVQGENSGLEVANAIDGLNALPEQGMPRRPDVIIVARGGGSLEDLMSFNEEIVVRAAARSRVPLIAAIGHETDWTLIDHAADLRAPTPTAAAEKAVPVRSELAIALAALARRQAGAILRSLERRKSEFRATARALPAATSLLGARRQQLDHKESRLIAAVSSGQGQRHLRLMRLAHRLAQQSPHAKLAGQKQQLAALNQRLIRVAESGQTTRRQTLAHLAARLAVSFGARVRLESERATACRQRVAGLGQRMRHGLDASLARRRQHIGNLSKVLASLDYHQVLARGYAVVRDANQKLLRRAAEVQDDTPLDIEFADGHRPAVAGRQKKPAAAKRLPAGRRNKAEQGSLL